MLWLNSKYKKYHDDKVISLNLYSTIKQAYKSEWKVKLRKILFI